MLDVLLKRVIYSDHSLCFQLDGVYFEQVMRT